MRKTRERMEDLRKEFKKSVMIHRNILLSVLGSMLRIVVAGFGILIITSL